ncbi:o-succinylbenzoate synthase [Opitutus sp. ER46]|uniref:o-succinylbenzoate synthase n=1 Tax=Opitutus sp. ER46 TaxID=2161864 RepID=UPI001E2C5C65|nr:o-succinylbenzoate synthase [Opitutus sp. ER46]
MLRLAGRVLINVMPIHLEYRRYRLPLRVRVRTAHAVWTERAGLVLRLTAEDGRVGWGEVAPIPAFGTETMEVAEETLRALGEWPTLAQLEAVPVALGCTRAALAMARAELATSGAATPAANAAGENAYRSVAALLPAGRPAVDALRARIEGGFRVFKWKVGVGDAGEELGVLDELCAALPAGAKLRLDANGAWERRLAERWLERCAERPIEFVEQPHHVPASAGEAALRRGDDLLLGLAHDFPTPIALDESVVGAGDVERWLALGWPGWFVVKPTLLGEVEPALARLRAAGATVVFSSALETAVGARGALRVAFAWSGERKALGFGVWPLFADARFDGPVAAPFIREQDVARLDPEASWNVLR